MSNQAGVLAVISRTKALLFEGDGLFQCVDHVIEKASG